MAEDEDKGYDLKDEPAEEEESEKQPENKDLDIFTESTELQKIITGRNKLYHEHGIRVPDLKDRIGRLNLDLFGDPALEGEWNARIDELEAEIETPITKRHPIAKKAKEVVTDIRQLQLEYNSLHKFYEGYVHNMGKLLDESITWYMKMEKAYRSQAYVEKRERGEQQTATPRKYAEITEGLVDDLLQKSGGQEFVDKFIEAYDKGDWNGARSAKGAFSMKGKAFFKDLHPDPKALAGRVFDELTNYRVLNKAIMNKISNPKKRPFFNEHSEAASKGIKESADVHEETGGNDDGPK